LDSKNCGVCGREIAGEDGVVCLDCRSATRRTNRKRLWYSGAAAVILIFVGVAFLYAEKNAWELSWDSLFRRPAVIVNGETITWSETKERFRITRLMLEKEYGKELFTGERGKAYLRDVERDVMERMVAERLVAQEARRLNIQVGDDRVKNEIQEIGREIYGSWENFQESLREDGISPEYLSAHVRNQLLRQEIKRSQAPAGSDPDEYFSGWLTRDRQNAKVTFNKAISPAEVSARGQGACCGVSGRASGAGCGGKGGGCGGQQAATGALDPQLKSEASTAALDAYRKTHPAEKDVAAQVTDYGCHVQVDIEKGGKIVRSYIYQNGSVTDNS
jgi:predicted nucleic acid-binding Zn ribbon protein